MIAQLLLASVLAVDAGSPAAAPPGAEPAQVTLKSQWNVGPHRGPVLTLAFSKDGTRVVTGAGDKQARLFDAATGKLLGEFKGASTAVTAVALSDDGAWVATGETGLAVHLYRADTGVLAREFPHPDAISSLAFSPDGLSLAVGGLSSTGEVYRVADGKKSWEFSGRSLAFSRDGKSMGTAVGLGALRLWDVATHKMKSEVKTAPHLPWLSANGELTVVATSNPAEKTVRLWNLITGKSLGLLEGHEKGVSSAALSADGTRLVSTSDDHTLRLWDVAARKVISHLLIEQLALVAISADGQQIAVAEGSRLQLYRVAP